VWSVKVERRTSNSGDFSTRSDPLPIVSCIPYLLLDRIAGGLYIIAETTQLQGSPSSGTRETKHGCSISRMKPKPNYLIEG
jgi:hypothetical protein